MRFRFKLLLFLGYPFRTSISAYRPPGTAGVGLASFCRFFPYMQRPLIPTVPPKSNQNGFFVLFSAVLESINDCIYTITMLKWLQESAISLWLVGSLCTLRKSSIVRVCRTHAHHLLMLQFPYHMFPCLKTNIQLTGTLYRAHRGWL